MGCNRDATSLQTMRKAYVFEHLYFRAHVIGRFRKGRPRVPGLSCLSIMVGERRLSIDVTHDFFFLFPEVLHTEQRIIAIGDFKTGRLHRVSAPPVPSIACLSHIEWEAP